MQTLNNHLIVVTGRAAVQGFTLPDSGAFISSKQLLTMRWRWLLIVLLMIVLTGCKGMQVQQQTASSLPSAPAVQRTTSPAIKAAIRTELPRQATTPLKREGRRYSAAEIMQILQLLDRAYVAEADKHLTTPSGSSAWDFYAQVLTIAPENEAARSGQGNIIDQYLSWIDGALRRGQPESARNYYFRLRHIAPQHPRSEALKQRISQMQREADKRRRIAQAAKAEAQGVESGPPAGSTAAAAGTPDIDAVAAPSDESLSAAQALMPEGVADQQGAMDQEGKSKSSAPDAPAATPQQALRPVVKPFPAGLSEYPLDAVELRDRSDMLGAQLAMLADEIKQRNARVLIEVPRDDQGRWVYQQLNLRHENYRIRAIIERTKRPVIRLLD